MRGSLVPVILGMAAVTYLTRSLFTVTVRHLRVRPGLERALDAVPLAVLTALVAPALLAGGGEAVGSAPYLGGGVITLLLARVTRSVMLAATAGTGAFLALACWVR